MRRTAEALACWATFWVLAAPVFGGWDEATNAYRAGSYEEAAILLESVVAAHPDYAPAYHLLGVSLGKLERWKESLPSLGRAVELEGGDPQMTFSLARAELEVGDPDGAFGTLSAIPLAEVGGDLRTAYGQLLAVASTRLENRASAVNVLEQGIEVLPESKDLWAALALARRSGGDLSGAFDAYSRALALAPTDADLARRAVDVAYAAAEQDSDGPERQLCYRQAADLAERLVSRNPSSDAVLLAGETHLFAGEHEAAREWLAEAVAQHPESAATRYHLASALSGLGDDEEALHELEAAVRLELSEDLQRRVLRLQGFTYRRLGQFDNAIAAYRRAGDDRGVQEAEKARDGAAINAELEQRRVECRDRQARVNALLEEGRQVLSPADLAELRRDAEKQLAECVPYLGEA